MAGKLVKINNFRIEFSSPNCKFDTNIKKKISTEFYTDKIFNINNFELNINNKLIKYSTFYTCPYTINNQIITKIKFSLSKSNIIIELCNKIFIKSSSLNSIDNYFINKLIEKKILSNKYIDIYTTFIIMYTIIQYDNNINNISKEYFINLLKVNYINLIFGNFNIENIISNILYETNLEIVKFYMSFYILLEEFHYKYIFYYFDNNLSIRLNQNQTHIFNSNYVKINPQEILNNINGEYFPDLDNLIDTIKCPLGHNILLISKEKKMYYYDPDEQIISDIFKIKIFFKNIGINFLNVSNKYPIQTIFDDGNCVFYCLRLVEYLEKVNAEISIRSLQKHIYNYENKICESNDMFKWIYNYIYEISKDIN